MIAGEEEGVWFLDLKNGKGSTGKGEPSHPADATLTMDSKNFFAMFQGYLFFFFTLSRFNVQKLMFDFVSTGKLKPAAAFMTGKLKINGNLQKAMKLEKLMGSLKSKL